MEARMAVRLAEFSDEELVVAALVGDLAAFDELVRRFRPAVRLTARRYVDGEDAVEDLCQEAFVRAFLALPQLEEIDHFGVWLHAIARNLARRQRQNTIRDRERFTAVDLPALEEYISDEPSPVELLERHEERASVRRLVEALPEPYRVIVYLHYWEGMPLSRAADYMGLPLTTVKWRLRRAQALMRQSVREPDGELAFCGGTI
jgi:RNA polymerase sigma-70 factor, ECF subfamily